MKYIPFEEGLDLPVVELTERNLLVLLAKLRDPASACTIVDPHGMVAVRAVRDEEHYKKRPPGVMYMPSTGSTI